MFTPYDKIVRDKIPRLIESQGKKVKYSVVSDEEAYAYLIEELFTKSTKFADTEKIDDLIDIVEVVFAIAELRGITDKSLLSEIYNKRIAKGGFEKNIVLEGVDNNE